jgi:hypothetical protein
MAPPSAKQLQPQEAVNDLENAVKLLVALIKKLDQAMVNRIKGMNQRLSG